MTRRTAPVAVALTLALTVLAACAGAPALTDPKEIITQGLSATAELTTVHFSATVDGSVIDPQSGSEISLTGTTASGDFAKSGSGRLTFAIPTLLGLTGDLIFSGSDLYVKASLLGEKWAHQALPLPSGAEPGSSGSSSPDHKAAALAEVEKFLAKDGVVTEKLEDVDCGDSRCYQVQVTIPHSLLAEHLDQADASIGEMLSDDLVIQMLFDQRDLWLTEISTAVKTSGSGSISVTISFSDFNAPVTVSPPPSDQIKEGIDFPGGIRSMTMP